MRQLDLVVTATLGTPSLSRRRYRWPMHVGRVFPDPAHPGWAQLITQNAAGTLIPGDRISTKVAVGTGARIALHGQGALSVTGSPGGARSCELARLQFDDDAQAVIDPGMRILFPHIDYWQRSEVRVSPSASAIIVDAFALHSGTTQPRDCDSLARPQGCPRTDTGVRIRRVDEPRRCAFDRVLLDETTPRWRTFSAFGTVTVACPDSDVELMLKRLRPLEGYESVYCAVSPLPYGIGVSVRMSASDGGALRVALASALGDARAGIRTANPLPAAPPTAAAAASRPAEDP